MSKQFPMVAEIRDARCFNCGGELVCVQESGHHEGHGALKGFCSGKCQMYTWFDVASWKKLADQGDA